MINKCPDCKSADVTEYTPGMFGDSRYKYRSCGTISSTDNFVEPTIFDQITQSPEVLAPKFVYLAMSDDYGRDYWGSSLFDGKFWNTREEANVATLAKLKEAAE